MNSRLKVDQHKVWWYPLLTLHNIIHKTRTELEKEEGKFCSSFHQVSFLLADYEILRIHWKFCENLQNSALERQDQNFM